MNSLPVYNSLPDKPKSKEYKLNIRSFSTVTETAASAAADIAGFIRKNPGCLLCLAAGDTPLPVFKSLVYIQSKGEVDLNSAFYVGLDEWVGLGRDTEGSCAQVMYDEFYIPAGIKQERICAWDGKNTDMKAERQRIEAWILLHGGISLALLGIGMNGHIGFNEPNTGLPEGTVFVVLDDTTKKVSIKYFKKELPIEYGIGIGAGELKKARKLILIATGSIKAEIVKKAVSDGQDEAVPASLLTDHNDITLYIDAGAASMIKA